MKMSRGTFFTESGVHREIEDCGREKKAVIEENKLINKLESCQVKKETVVSTLSTTDKFTIMYSNVDSLPNKKQELVAFINNAPCKPKLIALTEFKHKNKWDTELSELAIPGYNICSNPNINSRGIIVYVSQDLLCKQLNYDSNFSEFILLEIACKDNTKLTLVCFIEAHVVLPRMTYLPL